MLLGGEEGRKRPPVAPGGKQSWRWDSIVALFSGFIFFFFLLSESAIALMGTDSRSISSGRLVLGFMRWQLGKLERPMSAKAVAIRGPARPRGFLIWRFFFFFRTERLKEKFATHLFNSGLSVLHLNSLHVWLLCILYTPSHQIRPSCSAPVRERKRAATGIRFQ